MTETSEFLHHDACPDCGSSDGLAVYTSGVRFCYVCKKGTKPDGEETTGAQLASRKRAPGLLDVDIRGVAARGIHDDTARKFRYGWAERNGDKVQVAQYTDKAGRVVGQKIRTRDKQFSWAGNPKLCGLFGRHIWRDGGRKVVITEGEVDALSVSQCFGNKYPVVSLKDGAGSAEAGIRAELEWLESFDEVILMFDQDEEGRKATEVAAAILSPGRCKVATLPLKDANAMLLKGRERDLVDAVWGAALWTPDGVLSDAELWDRAANAETQPSIAYPWKGVQDKLRGMRGGELVLFTAGSGIGKTTVVRELAAHLVNEGEKVGWIALEESARDSVLGFLSIKQNHPLHLDRAVDWDALKPVWDETYAGNVTCYDHFGSLAGDRLLSRIRYMVVGLGCKWVVLDHVSIVVSGLEIGDERKAIDVLMTKLRSLVEETGCGLLLVSHLKRRDSKQGAYESGSMPKLSDLRGSASLEQLSNAVVALGRAQDEGSTVAEVAVLKNRFASITGPAGTLEYDLATGRYNEITAFEALENSL